MKILIVDDHPGMARSMARSLQRLGHQTLLADSALTALRLLGDDVDAIVSEIDLPRMNGVELARVVLRRWPGTGIAFYTVDDGTGDALFLSATRIGYVLPKPWTREDLATMLSTLVIPATLEALDRAA